MNAIPKGYRYSDEFPREAFVQHAIEAYFTAQGYQIEDGGYTDLVCSNSELKQRWIIEAKGQTADVGLDFRTGLGQLLQAMRDQEAFYGLAVPDIPQYLAQCKKVSDWVRRALRLHWLLVQSDGSLRIVSPDQLLI